MGCEGEQGSPCCCHGNTVKSNCTVNTSVCESFPKWEPQNRREQGQQSTGCANHPESLHLSCLATAQGPWGAPFRRRGKPCMPSAFLHGKERDGRCGFVPQGWLGLKEQGRSFLQLGTRVDAYICP